MRAISTALLVLALSAGSVFAESTQNSPLPAGKPAGVKPAQMLDSNKLLIIAGVGAVGAGFGILVSTQGGTNAAVSTSTGTSP
jgi:hypothetical protein